MRSISKVLASSLLALAAFGATSSAQTVPPYEPPESTEWPGIPYPYPDGDGENSIMPHDTMFDLSLAEVACVIFHGAAGGGDPDFVDRVCDTNLTGNNPPDDGE